MLRSEAFLAGEVSTAFLGSTLVEEDALAPVPKPVASATAAAVALAEQAKRDRTVQHSLPVAWRNVVSQPQVTEFENLSVAWFGGRDGYRVDGYDVLAATPGSVTLGADGVASAAARSLF